MVVGVVKKRTWKRKGVDIFEQNVVTPLLEHDRVEAIEYTRSESYQTAQYHWLLGYIGRYKLGRQITRTIQKNDYETVFLPFQELLTFDPSTVSSRIIPYVHDILPTTTTFSGPIPTLLARQYVRNLCQCSLVLCASEQTKIDLLHRTAFDNRAEVVYQGVAPPPTTTDVPTKYDLLYIGSLHDRKNPALLRRCFEQATKRGFSCVAVLSEYDDEVDLSCEVRSQVTQETLWELFAASRFYLHPSKQEGFGRPPVEAQSIGTPVIALETPINDEILGQKNLAWLPIKDPVNVADILQEIEIREYNELCDGAVENAKRFNWERTYEGVRQYLFRDDVSNSRF